MGIITSDVDVATNRLLRRSRMTFEHLEPAVDSRCGVLAAPACCGGTPCAGSMQGPPTRVTVGPSTTETDYRR